MLLSKDDSVPAGLVVAVSPLRWPSARGVAAAARGGGLGVLDLTDGGAAGAEELALLGSGVFRRSGSALRTRWTCPTR
nr:hypothetical protein [Amycolatopsis sp. Hca4]